MKLNFRPISLSVSLYDLTISFDSFQTLHDVVHELKQSIPSKYGFFLDLKHLANDHRSKTKRNLSNVGSFQQCPLSDLVVYCTTRDPRLLRSPQDHGRLHVLRPDRQAL